MRIGELARRAGVSARSVRYYEQQGLISAERAYNGYRQYDDLAAVRVANIRDLLAIGLTTPDIRVYLERGCLDRPLAESPYCASELDTVQGRLENLDERIDRLQRIRERLADHQARIRRAVHDGEAI